MKKLFTLVAGMALLLSPVKMFAGPGDTLGVSADTEPMFAPNNVTYVLRYGSVDSGFVYGTLYSRINNWLGFAQAYTNFDTVEVTKILAFIPYKAKGPANTPETKITYRLYNMSNTGAFSKPDGSETGIGPGTAALALKEQLFDDVDTTRPAGPAFNVITLDEPVKYSGRNIIIAVDFANLKAAGDTVGFLSDQPGAGMGLNYTYHQVDLGGTKNWMWSNPVFLGALDNNVAVFPVLKAEPVNSLNDVARFQSVKALMMPNPSNDISTLQFDVQHAGNYKLEIISDNGKLVAAHDLGMRQAGQHQEAVNVSALASGTYLYSIVNKEAGIRYTKTMVVAH